MSAASDAIRKAARRYGLDPSAMMRVARAESGLNPRAMGDSGSSYGLFQLHIGGALGHMTKSQASRYLDPYLNADFAARGMAKYARGLSGQAAVEAMVRGFERPADPSGEIARAMGLDGGTSPDAGSYGTSPAAQVSSSGGGTTIDSLMRSSAKLAGIANPVFSTDVPGAMDATTGPDQGVGGGTPDTTGATTAGPGGFAVTGGYPLAKHGKIIGTPYSGTHSLGNWESDNAIDISVPVGTPVVAAYDGVIGKQFGSLGSGGRFAGLRLHLVGKGNEAYYAHLSKFARGIGPGTRVRKGQIIGYSGSANGVAHLHFAVHNGDPRRYG